MVLALYSIIFFSADRNVERGWALTLTPRFRKLFQRCYAVDRWPLTLRYVHKLVEQYCILTIQADVLFYVHTVTFRHQNTFQILTILIKSLILMLKGLFVLLLEPDVLFYVLSFKRRLHSGFRLRMNNIFPKSKMDSDYQYGKTYLSLYAFSIRLFSTYLGA